MIVPLQSDQQFLADVTATIARRQGVSLWWLGQSGFLVHYDGVCIAIDPYLSDSLTHKYAATAKPHVRVTARVVDPALLAIW
jgi:L-ascorbate metabolism protein UlaG (beta-lactamase superfamily)